MSDLTDAQDLLTALKKARASGVLRTRHGDTEITYKSDTEMAAAIAALEAQIAGLGGTTQVRQYQFVPCKDL